MMDRTEELFEQIENYLEERLTTKEKLTFETRINNDEALRLEVEKHRDLHNTLQNKEGILFRKKLQKICSDEKNKKKSRSIFLVKYWKIAASILIILSFSTFWWVHKDKTTNDLFITYYSAYPIEDQLRGNTNQLNFNNILNNYSKKKYEKIKDDMLKLVETNPNNATFVLYLGNCYLNTGEEIKAIKLFKQIKKEDSKFETAQWYLALTHLKLNQIKATKDVLEEIVSYNGLYKEKSSELLRQLSHYE